MPVMRPTVDDYWRQQVKHDAIGDPDFWEWWLRRPDGAYARVKSKSPKLIVGWSGEKRSTTKF
jgi:hypothetical protein